MSIWSPNLKLKLRTKNVEMNKWYQVSSGTPVKFVGLDYVTNHYEVLYKEVNEVRKVPMYAIRGINFTPRPDLDKEDLVQTDLKDLLK